MNKVEVIFFWALLTTGAYADTVRFESGTNQTTMIELFTSQGCSSCPPAEKWINSLIDNPGLWTEFVPLAFHVDYWDRLGWKDIYAKPEHTKRQYRYQQDGNVRVVYTPGFFVNGQEWRSHWWNSELPTSKKQVGELVLNVENGAVQAQFSSNNTAKKLILNLALLGVGIRTDVKAGENSGHVLAQEFVVLGHRQLTSSNGAWQLKLPIASQKAPKYAVVAWVSDVDNQSPIQATGGWLPN